MGEVEPVGKVADAVEVAAVDAGVDALFLVEDGEAEFGLAG